MKALTELSSQVWAEGIRDNLQQPGASAPPATTNGCACLTSPPATHPHHQEPHFSAAAISCKLHALQMMNSAQSACSLSLQGAVGGGWASQWAVQCR
jgi:hypothetical protein